MLCLLIHMFRSANMTVSFAGDMNIYATMFAANSRRDRDDTSHTPAPSPASCRVLRLAPKSPHWAFSPVGNIA